MSNASYDNIHATLLSVTIFAVFLFQVLITFSVPVAYSLYFLSTSEAGGVRFGLWGWCLPDGTCSTPQLGYTWEPQLPVPITGALVFYPIGAILTFFALVSIIPTRWGRSSEKTRRVFFAFALSSFLVSLLAFICMIAMWNAARLRFLRDGFDAQFGPLPWLSILSTLILGIVVLIAWPPFHCMGKSSAKDGTP